MKVLFLSTLFFSLSLFALAQLHINEACSSNQNIIEDEFGETSDWIEIYNSSSVAINLEGYFLSDNENNLKKWQFPATSVAPNDFLLIFASGEDLLAIHPHTNFKLSKSGEVISISNPSGELIDQLIIPALESDQSFGHIPNGSNNLAYFIFPSPESSNDNSSTLERAPSPTLSISENVHPNAINLSINCSLPNCVIRYSLDGSIPDESSEILTENISIDTTTAIRAVAFIPGMIPSLPITKTYFIGDFHEIPVVAITSEPEHFFDWDNGIFEFGPEADPEWPYWGANFWKDIKIPIYFEYLNKIGELQLELNLGGSPHGGRGARTKPQKPLRLLAEQQYGTDKIEFPFFDHKSVNSFERLVLRNSSGDFNRTHFRDGVLSRLFIKENLDIDALAYQPVILYVNGMYWGLINLREKSDEFFIQSNYGLSPYDIDLLEEDTIAVAGDYEKFNQDYDIVINQDLSLSANFDHAASLFDLESLADYFIAQTVVNNSDWPQNNIKYWRTKTPDGKWRYLLFDLDTSSGNYSWTMAGEDGFGQKMNQFGNENRHINIFKAFLKNEAFHHYFINRYADLLNTTFRSVNFKQEITLFKNLLRPEMPDHFERWGACGDCNSFLRWDTSATTNFIAFAENRAPFARQFVQDYFDLENQVHLKFKTYPENAGTVLINTIQPEKLPWDGWYFNGIPISISIVPNAGFEFQHWQSLNAIPNPNQNPNLQLNFETDDEITAYFKAEYNGLNLEAFPNLVTESVEIRFLLSQIEQVKFKLFDTNGRLIETFPELRLNGGRQNVLLKINPELTGIYFLNVQTEKENATVKLVVK